jgi:glutaminyl-peptide cyclotransferase
MTRRVVTVLSFNALLVVAVVLVIVGPSGGDRRDPAPVARAAGFDGGRAWAELRRQVRMGPRPAGSATLRRLAVRLRAALANGRFEPLGPQHPGLRNVVGTLPGAEPAIVVAAHYDTKDVPGFVGANDGAGGTAAVLELARVLSRGSRPAGAPELRFVLFDGEEATDDAAFLETGLRGSKAYAARHASDLRALILLDFVAAKGLRIQREANSDAALWERLRAAARRVGAARAFPPGTGSGISDDHIPFLQLGVPSIDLIQWPYGCWHQPCDDLSAVSRGSLDLAGEAVLELVRTLTRT